MSTITWGGMTGDWATGSYWVGGVAPGAADSALIDGTAACTITVDAPESVVGVALSDRNAVLAIQTGTLTLGGVMALSAGRLDVESGGYVDGLAGVPGANGSASSPPGGAGGGGYGGVSLGAMTTLTNAGAITGGAGGYGGRGSDYGFFKDDGFGGSGGAGAVGVTLEGGWLVNAGVIQGGSGGGGGAGGTDFSTYYGGQGGVGGAGGLGVLFGVGYMSNSGAILGGAGGGGGQGGEGYHHSGPDGGGGMAGSGIAASGAGIIVNRASGDISGCVGVSDSGSGNVTLTNFGTIVGTGGTSVGLANASDRLIVEAGSVFEGAVAGGGGTLELAPGTGTISGLGGGGTVSGEEALNFSGFGAYAIDGGSWKLAGTDVLASTQRLAIGPGVTIHGAVAGGGGTLELAGGTGKISGLGGSGTISGAEALRFSGFGAYVIDAGGSWTLSGPNALGSSQSLTIAGDLTVNASLSLAGDLTQTGGKMRVGAGDVLTLGGSMNTLAGTVGGAGTVAFDAIGGTVALTGADLWDALTVISGPTVTLSGKVTMVHKAQVTTANMIVGAGGATLTGGGTFTFSNLFSNRIYGADAGATLTNDDRIKTAGLIGDGKMVLVNNGIIDDLYGHALVIDTAASQIVNSGIIECRGTGGVTVKSAVDNTGTLGAYAGVLTVDEAVTGTGKVKIAGGTADFAAGFSENVVFAGAGELELARARSYAGRIAGFSTTGTDVLDLRDIAYAKATTTASYSGTTTSGVLTVTDGSHTATISFVGDYLTSKWTLASDGHGGTTVVDPSIAPPPGAASQIALHPFIAAAAGFGARAAGGTPPSAEGWRPSPAALGLPRALIA